MEYRRLALPCVLFAAVLLSSAAAFAGGGPQNVVVVVNDNSPESLEVANYYRIKRRIPDRNFCHLKLPTGYAISSGEYEKEVLRPLLNHIEKNGLKPHVRFVVFTIGTPYRVNVESPGSTRPFPSSITTVTAAGGADLSEVAPHRLYGIETAFKPARGLPFLSMMLTGWTVADVRKCIDQGVAADGKRPRGTIYLFEGVGARARVHPAYGRQEAYDALAKLGVKAELRPKHSLTDEQDVMGYWTGAVRVTTKGIGFLPGAIAEHLTSFGGQLHANRGQMKILDFIAAGVTGAHGTVAEPTNHPMRFSRGWVFERYASGFSLIESFYMAVENLRLSVFVGEPLASPWAVAPVLGIDGLSRSRKHSGVISGVKLTATPGRKGSHIRSLDFWVDGRFHAPAIHLVPRPGIQVKLEIGDRTLAHEVAPGENLDGLVAALADLVNEDEKLSGEDGVKATGEGTTLRLESRTAGPSGNTTSFEIEQVPPNEGEPAGTEPGEEEEPGTEEAGEGEETKPPPFEPVSAVTPFCAGPSEGNLTGGREDRSVPAHIFVRISGKKTRSGDTVTVKSLGRTFTATAGEGEALIDLIRRLAAQFEDQDVFRKRTPEEIEAIRARSGREPSPIAIRASRDRATFTITLASVKNAEAGNGQDVFLELRKAGDSDLKLSPAGKVEMEGGRLDRFHASTDIEFSALASELEKIEVLLDTSSLPDGEHTLRLVAEEQLPLAVQGFIEIPFRTANRRGKVSVKLDRLDRGDARIRKKGKRYFVPGPVKVMVRLTGGFGGRFERLVLYVDGREAAQTKRRSAGLVLDPAKFPLGRGEHTIVAVAEGDNPGVRSDPLGFVYEPPEEPAKPAEETPGKR